MTDRNNKSLLLGALLLIGLSVGIAYHSLQAMHAHTWVNLGVRMHRRLVPPFIGFAVALGVAAVGVFCGWGCVKARRAP